MSRRCYGSPRVHAELRLGLGMRCSRKRVERLMRQESVVDVTEHPTGTGKVDLAVVLDAFSRRVVGWSVADRSRSELVVDAVQMATRRRQPELDQTVAHSDHLNPLRTRHGVRSPAPRRRAAWLDGIHR